MIVDCGKAFDSVELRAIWAAMENARIDSRYTNLLQKCHPPRHTISPKLFTLAMEDVFKKLPWQTNVTIYTRNHVETTKRGIETKHVTIGQDIDRLDDVRGNRTSMVSHTPKENIVDRIKGGCMQHAWYLNVDWQVYLVSPLFLLLLPKYPITGLLSMFSGIMASMGASFYITWDKELPASNLNGKFLSYSNTYYFKTHTRISPWLIGGLLGYVLAKIKLEKNIEYQKMPKWLIGVIWILVLAVLPACVFAGYDTQTSLTNHRLDNSFFNAFSRPAWGLCIAWIIFASSIGYGGMDNKFNFIMAGIPNTKPIEL
ncbi:hypothetical protein HUJ05_007635 [Dendroctonus ponderosae]|nr:hypothetical protein HUJ05_007635 [Dendroctonus ponderosae]